MNITPARIWKDDYALDEEGLLPKNLKRGVLSEDGIYDALERNRELMERIRGDENGKENCQRPVLFTTEV